MTTMRQRKRRLNWRSLAGRVTEPATEAMRAMASYFATSPRYTVEGALETLRLASASRERLRGTQPGSSPADSPLRRR